MSLVVVCPSCGAKSKVRGEAASGSGKCPKCGTSFAIAVPRKASAAPTPALPTNHGGAAPPPAAGGWKVREEAPAVAPAAPLPIREGASQVIVGPTSGPSLSVQGSAPILSLPAPAALSVGGTGSAPVLTLNVPEPPSPTTSAASIKKSLWTWIAEIPPEKRVLGIAAGVPLTAAAAILVVGAFSKPAATIHDSGTPTGVSVPPQFVAAPAPYYELAPAPVFVPAPAPVTAPVFDFEARRQFLVQEIARLDGAIQADQDFLDANQVGGFLLDLTGEVLDGLGGQSGTTGGMVAGKTGKVLSGAGRQRLEQRRAEVQANLDANQRLRQQYYAEYLAIPAAPVAPAPVSGGLQIY